jgi:hypothetical protein
MRYEKIERLLDDCGRRGHLAAIAAFEFEPGSVGPQFVPRVARRQRGVLRTNCKDSLDRHATFPPAFSVYCRSPVGADSSANWSRQD